MSNLFNTRKAFLVYGHIVAVRYTGCVSLPTPLLSPVMHTYPQSSPVSPLSKLLLDEEGAQIAQLPRAGYTQHRNLYQCPPHHPRVDILTLISKLSFPLTLEDLFSSNILQPSIQILDLLRYLSQLLLVAAFDL